MKKINVNIIIISIALIIISSFFITNSKTISVSGKCIRKVKKDKYALNIEVKNTLQNSSEAMKKSLDSYKNITETLKNFTQDGIEVETTKYLIEDRMEWNKIKQKSEKIGTEAIIGIRIITTTPEILGKIIYTLSDYKDVYTSNFENFVSTELYEKEKENCLKEAMQNAKQQAMTIASSVGQSVGKLESANYYNSSNNHTPIMYRNRMVKEVAYDSVATTGALTPEIFGGSEEISVNVDTVFKLK